MCSYAWSCLTLCDPIGCSPPGSFVHGILQARVLERVAISSSRGSSRPRDRTHVSSVSWLAGGLFTTSALWGTLMNWYYYIVVNCGDQGFHQTCRLVSQLASSLSAGGRPEASGGRRTILVCIGCLSCSSHKAARSRAGHITPPAPPPDAVDCITGQVRRA